MPVPVGVCLEVNKFEQVSYDSKDVSTMGSRVGHMCGIHVRSRSKCTIGNGHMGSPPPKLNRMVDTCENMSLPQFIFAGGNKSAIFSTNNTTSTMFAMLPNINLKTLSLANMLNCEIRALFVRNSSV